MIWQALLLLASCGLGAPILFGLAVDSLDEDRFGRFYAQCAMAVVLVMLGSVALVKVLS